MKRSVVSRCLALALALLTVLIPVVYYRSWYVREKRVRVVTAGKVYRSGQLTREGLEDVIRRYGIRTVINLRDEEADPLLDDGTFESEICRQHGVNYRWLPPLLVEAGEPSSVEEILAVCDDKNAYPILLHCKAGLHRTGILAAFYRVEYEGWSKRAALEELNACGFSLKRCNVKNLYIKNYLVDYVPRARRYTGAGSSGGAGVLETASYP